MRKLFERIVDFMEENGSIQSEYRDVYLFALQTVAVYAFNIGTGVVIGAAFGELLYCMIFLIAFMLLRAGSRRISRTGMDELLFSFMWDSGFNLVMDKSRICLSDLSYNRCGVGCGDGDISICSPGG